MAARYAPLLTSTYRIPALMTLYCFPAGYWFSHRYISPHKHCTHFKEQSTYTKKLTHLPALPTVHLPVSMPARDSTTPVQLPRPDPVFSSNLPEPAIPTPIFTPVCTIDKGVQTDLGLAPSSVTLTPVIPVTEPGPTPSVTFAPTLADVINEQSPATADKQLPNVYPSHAHAGNSPVMPAHKQTSNPDANPIQAKTATTDTPSNLTPSSTAILPFKQPQSNHTNPETPIEPAPLESHKNDSNITGSDEQLLIFNHGVGNRYKATHDFNAEYMDELTFKKGEFILVLYDEKDQEDEGYFIGQIEGQPWRRGLFPINFVTSANYDVVINNGQVNHVSLYKFFLENNKTTNE